MNSNGLAKLYDRLTPRERLPLIVAASVRGDEPEADRLARSAPTLLYRVPDYRGLSEALLDVSLLCMIRLLDLAAQLWHAEGLIESNQHLGKGEEKQALTECRLMIVLRLNAYLLVTELEAWGRFCGELNLEPDALLRDLPGYDTTKRAEDFARGLAFSPEKAAETVRLKFDNGAQIVTVESALDDYRKALTLRENR